MIGYDGRQCSDTYSVAHQVDFLTQKVFHPATKKYRVLFTLCVCVCVMEKFTEVRIKVENSEGTEQFYLIYTFHLAAVQ